MDIPIPVFRTLMSCVKPVELEEMVWYGGYCLPKLEAGQEAWFRGLRNHWFRVNGGSQSR